MIAIIDYGAGNIFSVKNALDYLGLENKLTSDKEEIKAAEKEAKKQRKLKQNE